MTLGGIYIENQDLAQILFACAVIAMMSSISIYLVEIIITVRAVGYLVKKNNREEATYKIKFVINDQLVVLNLLRRIINKAPREKISANNVKGPIN